MSLNEFIQRKKPNFLANELKKIIFPECQTLLDVGCGCNSVVQYFKGRLKKTVGVDMFGEAIKESRRKRIHNRYINCNVLDIKKQFGPKSFDCVISIDVIEHLKKNEAKKLIREMEIISKRYVVIQTTNGFIFQGPEEGNPYQVHRCGFMPDDLKRLGYRVIGMDGPKILRGKCAKIKHHPMMLFAIIANLLTPIFKYLPSYSFNMLAYKKI